jgi:predicted DNA binding CopG/RHH family protein
MKTTKKNKNLKRNHSKGSLKDSNNEAKEREIYLSTDFGDLLLNQDPLDLDIQFPSPTQSINIRLPRTLLNRIKILADEQDVPYQSLIKSWLFEKIKKSA